MSYGRCESKNLQLVRFQESTYKDVLGQFPDALPLVGEKQALGATYKIQRLGVNPVFTPPPSIAGEGQASIAAGEGGQAGAQGTGAPDEQKQESFPWLLETAQTKLKEMQGVVEELKKTPASSAAQEKLGQLVPQMTHYAYVSDSLLANLGALLHRVYITQTHVSQGRQHSPLLCLRHMSIPSG